MARSMGAFPFTPVATLSLGVAYWLSRQSERSVPAFLANFAGTFLFQFFLWALWEVLLYPNFFSPLIGLPEPAGGSFWNGQHAAIAANPTGVPMIEWVNTIAHNGLIRYRSLFNLERVLIVGPKALSEVLVTNSYEFEKPSNVRFFIGRLLGIGVLLAEGDEHKFQRRNLLPAFAFRHIKDLYSVFWAKSREGVLAMAAQIQEDAAASSDPDPGKPGEKRAVLEVGSWASRVTLDIIGIAGMGRDFGAIRDPSNHLYQIYQRLFKPSPQAAMLTLLASLLPDWVVSNLPFSRNNDVGQSSGEIRAFCADVIKEKQEKLSRKALTDTDILSVALESGAFSEDNLVDQMMTFLAAGHETTASAMTWAIYLLCVNPEMQTRLREEVRANLPSPDDEPGSSAVGALEIDRLAYLNAVVSEVLRYFAPVPMTIRRALRDTVVQGIVIPKGTKVMICPWAINKDMALWGRDAGKFDPDRWIQTSGGDLDDNDNNNNNNNDSNKLAGNGGACSNYAFMTFMHGPRSCIGASFSRAELACLLATWVGRMEFGLKNKDEMDEKNIHIKGNVTAKPANGLHVWAKVLDGW